VNDPPNIVFTEVAGKGIVMINNWTVVNLNNYQINELECEAGPISIQLTYTVHFFTLSKSNFDLTLTKLSFVVQFLTRNVYSQQ